ncbi:MAG: ABC transporter ATP-binding protein [Treponema sp.]
MSKPQKKRHWYYTCRGFALYLHKDPRLLAAILCEKVCSGILPFIGIYFSARIINELLLVYDGTKQAHTSLVPLIILSLAVTAGTMLTASVIRRWKNYEYTGSWFKTNAFYMEKWLKTDFQNRESTGLNELYTKIQQNNQWGAWGLNHLLWLYENACGHIVALIASIGLTLTLFTAQVQTEALLFLNSPVFIAVLAAVLIALPMLSARLGIKSDSYWTKADEQARHGNRVFGFVMNLIFSKQRAMDVRLYEQYAFAETVASLNTTFTTKGILAAYARKQMGFYGALSQCAESALMIFIYIFVGLKAFGGAFPAGQVMQYIASITALSSALAGIFELIGKAKINASFLQDTFDFLDTPDTMQKGKRPLVLRPDGHNIIEFKNVSFTYPGSETPALQNLTFTLSPNERLAIVGKNGSGKTTFIKLLCRLYDPDEGEIFFNGVNITEYDYRSYLAAFSVVFQDFKLLAFSLAQNIAAGEHYDKARVKEVLAQTDFNLNPDTFTAGENTYLYKDFEKTGVTVSGGEAQKIAIARALYKNAPYIILDEPTAALDPLTEQEIYAHFNGMVKNRTAVYISHRLSSCRFCSTILVFDQGRIVQQGTHETLVTDSDGLYHKLWNAQAQYYTEKKTESE